MAPEMGVAPLDGVSGMGLTGGDMPVQVAPYGVTPELGGPQGADDIEAAIAGLQSADRTRGGGVMPDPGLRDDEKAGRGFGRSDVMSGLVGPADTASIELPSGTTGSGGRRATRDNPVISTDAIPVLPENRTGPRGRAAPGDLMGLTPDMEGLLPPSATPEDVLATIGVDTTDDARAGRTNAPYSPSLKKDPPAEVGGGTGGSGKPAGAGTAAVPVDETPVKENPLNALQQFTQDKFGWDEDKRGDMSEALMSAGFAMMAGDSPDWAQNVGKGGLVGIEAYQGAKDQRRSEGLEEDALAMEKELHALRMAEGSRAAEKHEMAKAKASQLAAMGPELDPRSPAGKLYMDAMELAERSDEPVEVVMERLIELGIYKDPREAEFEE